MSKETFNGMLEDIEKALNNFIMSGHNTGFKFDERCAESLNEIKDNIVYLFEVQQNEIDALRDSLEHKNFNIASRWEEIKRLSNERDRYKKEWEMASTSNKRQ